MYDFLLIVQTIVVLLLIGIILVQRSDSDGFGTGTGGGGGNQFMTGRASANLMTRATAILATIFIVLSLILAKISGGATSSSIVDLVEKPAVSTSAPLIDAEAPSKPAVPASVPKPE